MYISDIFDDKYEDCFITDKEQQQAIELTKQFTKMNFNTPNGWTGYYDTELKELSQAIETVLNMLKEKDKKINRKSSTIKALQCALYERTEERDRKNNIIAKQNKMIDLMAEYITTLDIEEDICSKIKNEHCDKMNFGECEDCIKQYFKSKAEKE